MRVLIVEDEPLLPYASPSRLSKRPGEPWIIATVPGVGHRIYTQPEIEPEGGNRG
jgi:hypothetical protein